MNKLRKQANPLRSFSLTVGYLLLGAALAFVAFLVYSSIQAESQAEQQRELRQQQDTQEQAEEAAAAAKEEEKRREIEYLKCQVKAEQSFISLRDQIPAGYSTSQRIQMLQTLEQKRSTDLENCDRRKG